MRVDFDGDRELVLPLEAFFLDPGSHLFDDGHERFAGKLDVFRVRGDAVDAEGVVCLFDLIHFGAV